MFFKLIRDLERRVKALEQAQRTRTWKHGEVDLVKLARIVESLDKKQETISDQVAENIIACLDREMRDIS